MAHKAVKSDPDTQATTIATATGDATSASATYIFAAARAMVRDCAGNAPAVNASAAPTRAKATADVYSMFQEAICNPYVSHLCGGKRGSAALLFWPRCARSSVGSRAQTAEDCTEELTEIFRRMRSDLLLSIRICEDLGHHSLDPVGGLKDCNTYALWSGSDRPPVPLPPPLPPPPCQLRLVRASL